MLPDPQGNDALSPRQEAAVTFTYKTFKDAAEGEQDRVEYALDRMGQGDSIITVSTHVLEGDISFNKSWVKR